MPALSTLALVCILTFVHYTAAQMRGPVLTLYADAHGASATAVGLILGAHMTAAAAGSIPLGRVSDVWGRRPLLLGGMAIGVVTSLLLPLAERPASLLTIYALAGLGVAAFTPSALSLVGDAAPRGRIAYAYGWYSTAHYGAIGVGPFVGGLVAEWWGYRPAFVASGIGIALALAIGVAVPLGTPDPAGRASGVTFVDIRRDLDVWAGWVVAASGLFVQGVVFPFFPLLGQERGLGPAAIGLVFLVLGLANTAARFPAGWLVDRTGRPTLYAIGGVLLASGVTVLLPHVHGTRMLLALAALFGAASGVAFVAISAGLAVAAPPAARGLVMGGYSTALYLGFGIGSIAIGPVIGRHGHAAGFALGGALGTIGTLVAVLLWRRPRPATQAPSLPSR
jgi:MFS family permease